MLKMKHVLPGDCWRFDSSNGDAPDHRPTLTYAGQEPKHPDGWDAWKYEEVDTSKYYETHGERPIELLRHYSTHPVPTPLDLRRRDLKPGDCFQYLEAEGPSANYVVDGRDVSLAGLTNTWGLVSTARSAESRMSEPVRRVAHWSSAAPPPSKILARHEEYVLVPGGDVPPGTRHVSGNQSVEWAQTYRDADLKNLSYTSKCNPDLFYWIEAAGATTDPRVRHDYGDGTGIVSVCDIGPQQPRSDCYVARLSIEEAAESLKDANDVGAVGRHVGPTSRTSGWVRVRIADLPGAKPEKPAPVVLPCVDPLKYLRDAIFVREVRTVGGLKGAECLRRFEKAQRTESIARTSTRDIDPARYVSTNASCGLTGEQIDEARELWGYKLRLLVAEAKQRDMVVNNQNVCDDPDEMPNMVYVDEAT